MTHPYAGEAYARSLPHVGEPFAVPEWSSHVLLRPTPCGTRVDAVGPYPLTVIAPDADLARGRERLRTAGAVSVVLVLDDRLRPDLAELEGAFEVVRPLKTHQLHDKALGEPGYGKHHRHEVRRALARVSVSEIALSEHLPAWTDLYRQLSARHGLTGVHAFPDSHHAALSRLSGMRAFGAFIEERLAAAHLFVVHQGYAVSHLAASSAEGYAAGAAYAVNDLAIRALGDCERINFGGGAGLGDDPSDGLVRFKTGFSNAAAPSYLCGAVLDPEAYAALSEGREDAAFFPAYRGRRRAEGDDADSR